jgi:hypothetical protein
MSEKFVLHLMTQDNQPHFSSRLYCERCGVMIWPYPLSLWTDNRAAYAHPPEGYVSCTSLKETDHALSSS